MKPILSLVLSTFLCAAALDAQTKPCFAMNDTNTNVSSVITLLAFAGPGQWAYQFTPASSLIVRGMRIYTGNKFQNAFMSLEVWSHDAAKKLPKARLAGGTWKNPKPTAIGWYGTNFDKAQALIKGTTYWLVWTDPGWSTPPIDPNSFNTMPYAQRFGTTAAFVAGSNQALKFRLYCSPIDVKGARVFGSSCASAAGTTGTAFTNTSPTVGNASFRIEGTGLPSGATTFLALGVNNKWSSLSLGPLAPGCYLNTDLLAVFTGKTGTGDVRSTTGALGHVSYSLPIPNNPSLKGVFVGSQIAVADAKSKNAIPGVFTNGLQITVQ